MSDRMKPVRGPWGSPYGSIMAELAKHSYAAKRLAERLGQSRPDMSRLLSNLKRAGYVEHTGAWHITPAGRAALTPAEDDKAQSGMGG